MQVHACIHAKARAVKVFNSSSVIMGGMRSYEKVFKTIRLLKEEDLVSVFEGSCHTGINNTGLKNFLTLKVCANKVDRRNWIRLR